MSLDELIAKQGIDGARAEIFAMLHTALGRLWASDPRISNERCTGAAVFPFPVGVGAASVKPIPVDTVAREDGCAPSQADNVEDILQTIRRMRRPKLNLDQPDPTQHQQNQTNQQQQGQQPHPRRKINKPSSLDAASIPADQVAVTNNPLDVSHLLAAELPALVKTLIDQAINEKSLPAARILTQLGPFPKQPTLKGVFAELNAPFTCDAEHASLRVLWLVNEGVLDASTAKELLELLRTRHDILKQDSLELRLQLLEDQEEPEAEAEASWNPLQRWPFTAPPPPD